MRLILLLTAFLIGFMIFSPSINASQNQRNLKVKDGESQMPGVLTMYWCGFGSCQDSSDNDVNPEATHIFLAYLSIRDNGEVFLDGEVPMDLFEEWRNNDQKLIISIGGMDFDWSMVYDNQENFISSLMQFLEQWQLSGVDLNVRSYDQPPERLLSLMEDIKGQLSNDQILILTVDSVTVIPGMEFPVHSLQQLQDGEEMFNYFVPIIKERPDIVDLVQISVYSHPYMNMLPDKQEILLKIIEGWVNKNNDNSDPDFQGLPSGKLILSVLASEDAYQSDDMNQFFLDSDSLNEGLLRLIEERVFIAGLNIYNSHFDKENAYEISDVGVRQFITLEAVTGGLGGEEPVDGESQMPGVLTIYWCGFGSCQDSSDNDVNPQATHILLAYLSIRDNGEVFLDGEVPMDLFEEWRNNDQKLIISIGGMDFDWSMVYDNQQQFVESLMQFLEQWQLSGVDLNIRSYDQPPERLLSLMEDIKGQLSNDQILVLTVDSVTVIPGMEFPVHSLQQLQDGEEMFNYFVPIIKERPDIVDLVQISVYSHPYMNMLPDKQEILLKIIEGWVNKNNDNSDPDFQGLPSGKLILSVLASEDAYQPDDIDQFFLDQDSLNEGLLRLIEERIFIAGLNIYNSHFDKENAYEISDVGVRQFITLEAVTGGEEPSDGESQKPGVLTIYWCGFGSCQDSRDNDVNPEATHILLAYLSIRDNGEVFLDGEVPMDLFEEWRNNDQKLIISIGGMDFDWSMVYDNQDNFLSSLMQFLEQWQLSGVDLNVRSYDQPPERLLSLLEDIKGQLSNDQILILTVDSVTVIPGMEFPVHSLQQLQDGEEMFNYFVPIIKERPDIFDLVQISVYSHPYMNMLPDKQEILLKIIEGWVNKNNDNSDPDFQGLPSGKLILSVLASEDAYQPDDMDEFFLDQDSLNEGLLRLIEERIFIAGLNIYNSHFDKENAYEISDVGVRQFITLEAVTGGEEPSDGESQKPGVLTIYWCGFGSCQDSRENDVNPEATHIFLAFLSVNDNGEVFLDGEVPMDLFEEWRNNGQKLIISVGGMDFDWSMVYDNQQQFVESLMQFLEQWQLSGVDLNIRSYDQPPERLLSLLEDIKGQLSSDQILILTVDSVTVIPGMEFPVHSLQQLQDGEEMFNYFVPIIKERPDIVDLVQISVYSHPYLNMLPDKQEILLKIIEGWVNKNNDNSDPDFQGLPSGKLILSVLASEDAYQPDDMDQFFLDQDSLNEGLLRLIEERIFIAGLNIYNSHFDKENAYEISDVGVRQFITLEEVTDGIEGEEYPTDGEFENILTIYWCGFGSCQDSDSNDVSPQATHILLAYLSIRDNGEVFLDGEVPMDLFEEWRSKRQKLIISIGGDDIDWSIIYDNQNVFVESLLSFINQWQLSGVDLNISTYEQAPIKLLQLLEAIKQQLSSEQILIITIDSKSIISDSNQDVPNLDNGQGVENYLVPIFIQNPNAFDLVQVKLYDQQFMNIQPGSVDSVIDVVEGWLNVHDDHNHPQFKGIPQSKVIISVLASPNVMIQNLGQYYIQPEDLKEGLEKLEQKGIFISGVNVYNSFYDQQNDFEVSSVTAKQILSRQLSIMEYSSYTIDAYINKCEFMVLLSFILIAFLY